MSHTFANLLTPSSPPRIDQTCLPTWWDSVRKLRGKAKANARLDHLHYLPSLPPTLAVAEALRVLETNSSLSVQKPKTDQPTSQDKVR